MSFQLCVALSGNEEKSVSRKHSTWESLLRVADLYVERIIKFLSFFNKLSVVTSYPNSSDFKKIMLIQVALFSRILWIFSSPSETNEPNYSNAFDFFFFSSYTGN